MVRVSYDPADFDFDRIIPFIQTSYWGGGRSAEQIQRSFETSFCVGLFAGEAQVGVVRAFSDQVFSAYINDLIVFEEYRGQGFARRLMDELFAHPDLAEVQGWLLATRDAHGLYEKYGFEPLDPKRFMGMKRD